MTLKHQWIRSMLGVVGLGAASMAAIAVLISHTLASYTAKGWLQAEAYENTGRLMWHWMQDMRDREEILDRVTERYSLSDNAERLMGLLRNDEVGGFVEGSSVRTLGACAGHFPVHPISPDGGLFWFECNRSYVVAYAMPRESTGKQEFLGRIVNDAFADDIADVTKTDVTLIDESGVVGTSIHNRNHQRVHPSYEGPVGRFNSDIRLERTTLWAPDYAGLPTGLGVIGAGKNQIPVYAFSAPLLPELNLPIQTILSVPDYAIRAGVSMTAICMTIGGVLILIALSLVVWRLVESLTKPIQQLSEATQRLAAGDRAVRVVPEGATEVRQLAESFNQMTASLDTARERAVQSEKMAAIGQLASGIAHEINNPLGVILGFAQGMEHRVKEGEPLRLPVSSIVRESIRCKNLVQELLMFSRTGNKVVEPMDLGELARATVSLLEARARTQGIRVVCNVESPSMVMANRTQLQQVLVNLGTNAFDAMANGGTLTIAVGANADHVQLTVTDTGSGIPENVRSRIFEPFFTTKGPGKGTGLGMSLVYEIVTQHHGQIAVASREGEGTCFTVTFPRHIAAAQLKAA